MKKLISFSIMFSIMAALIYGVNHGNTGLVMLAKVYSWLIVFSCLFVAFSKEVAEKMFEGGWQWTQSIGVPAAIFVGFFLAYHGHWITGSALVIGEIFFLAGYFKLKDSGNATA